MFDTDESISLPNNISYEEWITWVFDHEVKDPAWHWDTNAPYWNDEADPRRTNEFLTRLFETPVISLKSYTDEQINQGLYFVISNNCTNHSFAMRDPSVPIDERIRCMKAILTLYSELFAPRCGDRLQAQFIRKSWSTNLFRRPLDEISNPLSALCYMWWETIPWGPNYFEKDVEAAGFDVMERALYLRSEACVESALHGLHHWRLHRPQRLKEIINKWLKSSYGVSAQLIEYARLVRSGGCL